MSEITASRVRDLRVVSDAQLNTFINDLGQWLAEHSPSHEEYTLRDDRFAAFSAEQRKRTASRGSIDEWHPTKSGNYRIRLHNGSSLVASKPFEVYVLDGHELLPATGRFATEAEARAYANVVWARY